MVLLRCFDQRTTSDDNMNLKVLYEYGKERIKLLWF